MFTGLVQDVGTIESADGGDGGVVLRIASTLAGDVAGGDSIAVNGCCLTVVRFDDGAFEFEVMNESLRRTSLGAARAGTRVNLEPALRASDRLGGHVVSGHVDGVATVDAVEADGFARILRLVPPPALLRHIVEKGSVCVDGVSLTVAAADDTTFTVSLIPETLERTTLGDLCERPDGRTVNIETDIMAKQIEKLVAASLNARMAGQTTPNAPEEERA